MKTNKLIDKSKCPNFSTNIFGLVGSISIKILQRKSQNTHYQMHIYEHKTNRKVFLQYSVYNCVNDILYRVLNQHIIYGIDILGRFIYFQM